MSIFAQYSESSDALPQCHVQTLAVTSCLCGVEITN